MFDVKTQTSIGQVWRDEATGQWFKTVRVDDQNIQSVPYVPEATEVDARTGYTYATTEIDARNEHGRPFDPGLEARREETRLTHPDHRTQPKGPPAPYRDSPAPVTLPPIAPNDIQPSPLQPYGANHPDNRTDDYTSDNRSVNDPNRTVQNPNNPNHPSDPNHPSNKPVKTPAPTPTPPSKKSK